MPLPHSSTTGGAFCRQLKVKLSFSIIWEATDEATVWDDQEHDQRTNISETLYSSIPSEYCWNVKTTGISRAAAPSS